MLKRLLVQCATWLPLWALWAFLWAYTNDWTPAKRVAFWAIFGL
jgi:hypothetical protein